MHVTFQRIFIGHILTRGLYRGSFVRMSTYYFRSALLAFLACVFGSGCSEETVAGEFTVRLSAAMKVSRCFGVPITGINESASPRDNDSGQLACLTTARDCGAVEACLGLTGQSCTPGSADTSCDGAVLNFCVSLSDQDSSNSRGFQRQIDCLSNPDGNTSCGTYNPCSDLPAEDQDRIDCRTYKACFSAPCTERGSRCEGVSLVRCEGGLKFVEDCSRHGLTCVENGRRAQCAQPGPRRCATNFCSGGRLVLCAGEVAADEIVCSDLHPDFVCIESDSGSYCGVSAPNRACEGEERECINGKAIGICVQGVWVTASCDQFLDGKCDYSSGRLRCVESENPEPGRSTPAERVNVDAGVGF